MLKLLLFLSFQTLVASKLLLRPIGFEFRSKSSRSDGCNFGIRHYRIGESWHPEVSPFGVLRCVLCSCVKHPKKTGNFGKVSCRSTRHRCPRSACSNPTYSANQCCPTCPPEFVALLTPPESSSSKPTSRPVGIARVHFTLVKSIVHISIRYEGNQRPKTLVFIGPKDKRLGELNIHKKFVNGTKVCLLWNDLDDRDVAHLTNDRVTLMMKFRRKNAGHLAGRVATHKAYSEEAFEALLKSSRNTHSHMAAVASFSVSRNGKTLHVNLRNSKLTHTGGKSVYVTLQFIKATHKGKTQVLHTIAVTSLKPEGGHGKAVWSGPSDQNLKWMARGILNVTLSITAGGQTVEMRGRIGIKESCNTLYAALAGRVAPRPTVTGASGYASFTFNDDGHLHYKVFLSGLMQPVIEINLEMSRRRVVKRLARAINPSADARAQVEGVWERPPVSVICTLYAGGASVVVRTALYRRGEMRGHIRQLPYGGHQLLYQDTPFLLSGNEVVPSTQTGAAGLAWFSLDRHCSLHYHVMLTGLDRGNRNTITAELQGFAMAGDVPMEFEKRKHTLRSFHGSMMSGVVRDLNPDFLSNILHGRVYVQISSSDNPRGELRSQLSLVSEVCRQRVPAQKTAGYTIEGSCISEGMRYFNGEAWAPDYDTKCTTCSCKDTKTSCFPIVCLPKNCSEALVMLPDVCCPVCPVMEEQAIRTYRGGSPQGDEGCFVDRGKRFYPSGAVWHPYVQPFGYMKCVVCTCLASINEINCNKVQCPRLSCPFPIKLHPSDCCNRCPATGKNKKVAAASKVCQFGQNTYPNGARWTPFILPFGLIKCVTCQCEKGKTNCSTVTCPKNHCKTSLGSNNKSCCAPCSGSKR